MKIVDLYSLKPESLCPHINLRMNSAESITITICEKNDNREIDMHHVFVGVEPCSNLDWEICPLNKH